MPQVALMIRREPAYRRAAFESGFKRLGYTITDKVFHPTSKADVLCLWNVKAGSDETAATLFEQRGGTVAVTENGYLAAVDKTYYALSLHAHNGAGWFPVGNEDRFSKLGFKLKPLRDNPDGHVLVCGQRGIGSNLMASPPQWDERMVAQLKRAGVKNVRLRRHPGNHAPRVPLLTDLQGCQRCVIWSSGAGVRALVEGVPVSYHAPHWICAGWERDRVDSLNRMAHNQWHFNEIETGEPFARLLNRNAPDLRPSA